MSIHVKSVHNTTVFNLTPLDLNKIWWTRESYRSEWKCQILALHTLYFSLEQEFTIWKFFLLGTIACKNYCNSGPCWVKSSFQSHLKSNEMPRSPNLTFIHEVLKSYTLKIFHRKNTFNIFRKNHSGTQKHHGIISCKCNDHSRRIWWWWW